MKSFEDNTHAFVVRVWLEPRELDGAPPEWRGVIEHVSSGARLFLQDLREIESFISCYVESMCANSGQCD
jgi:hypothetical protein